MLEGTELRLEGGGFAFAPYRMLVANPLLPVPVQVSANDICRWLIGGPKTHRQAPEPDAREPQLDGVAKLASCCIPAGVP
jgi:hypothetical protein